MKISGKSFLATFLVLCFVLSATYIIFAPKVVLAQVGSDEQTQTLKQACGASPADIQLQINIPGVTYEFEDKVTGITRYYVKDLACYIAGFYRYFAIVSGILATVMMMFGGFKYVTSFGNPTRISDAKDNIVSATVGIIIVLGSYLLLFTINPALVDLKMPKVTSISPSYQDAKYCEDLMGEPYNKTIVPNSGNCGDEGKEEDTGAVCVFRGTDCNREGYVCASMGMLEGGAYKCLNAKDVCETSATQCSTIDDMIGSAGITSHVCIDKGGSHCEWKGTVHCGYGQGAPIPCDAETPQTSTSCWNNDPDNPRPRESGGHECINGVGKRYEEDTASICCGAYFCGTLQNCGSGAYNIRDDVEENCPTGRCRLFGMQVDYSNCGTYNGWCVRINLVD